MALKPGYRIKQSVRSLFLVYFLAKLARLAKRSSYKAVKFVLTHTDFTNLLNLYKFKTRYPLDEDQLAIVSCWGIGDTVMVAGLAQQLVAQKIARKIVLIVKPGHYFIPQLFPGISKVYVLDSSIDYLDRPLNYLKLPPQHLKEGEYYYGHFFNHDIFELIGYRQLNILDAYKAIFKLDKQTKLNMPAPIQQSMLNDAAGIFEQYSLPHGKTVLLATGANSIPLIKKEFWQNITAQLVGAGYTILLNSKEDEYLAGNTVFYIDIPLPQIVAVAKLAGNVVSIRSGLCDLLSLYDIKLAVIYPQMQWMGGSLFDGASIKAMWPAPYVTEFELTLAEAAEKNAQQDALISRVINTLA